MPINGEDGVQYQTIDEQMATATPNQRKVLQTLRDHFNVWWNEQGEHVPVFDRESVALQAWVASFLWYMTEEDEGDVG